MLRPEAKIRGGFTLIEVIVYGVLAVLIMGVAAMLFFSARRTNEAVITSYNLGPNLSIAVRQIRRDLQNAPLASVAVSESLPGLTLQSAHSGERIVIGDQGVPKWQKFIHYGLEPKTGGVTADLVRWEEVQESVLPLLSQTPPWPPTTNERKVILHDLAAPNATLEGVGEKGELSVDGWGGFRVQFLRREINGDWTPSTANPSAELVGGSGTNNQTLKTYTRVIEVELKQYVRSGTGKSNFFALRFRAAPRY